MMGHDTAIAVARILIAFTVTVSSLEMIAARALFSPDGMLSWALLRTAYRRAVGPVEAVRDTLFAPSGLHVQFALRILLALALVWPVLTRTAGAAICVALLVSNIVLTYRSSFGGDGSDQMTNVILAGLAFDGLADPSSSFHDAGLWFIAIQCVLSYFVSGVAKAISPMWRSGKAPAEILRSATYGSAVAARIFKAIPHGSWLVAWSTIVVECCFPLALIAPLPVVVLLLVAGALFHVGNAAFMGLNTFLTAFLAAYPFVVLFNPQLR